MTIVLASTLIPIKTVSEANQRDGWRARASRAKKQRLETWATMRTSNLRHVILGPIVVTMTRIGPRKLDSDNLAGSMKACRDGVADFLKIDDGDSRIEWRYAQRSDGKAYAVHVEIACA